MASPMYSCEGLSNRRGPQSAVNVYLFSDKQAEHAKLRNLLVSPTPWGL